MTMNFQVVFRSLDARRHAPGKDQVNISNNSTITSVTMEEGKLSISFVFSSNYEPNIGSVRIEGDVKVDDKKEVLEGALTEWEKSNKTNLPKDMAEKVHNNILTSCLVEASILARDLRLPAPIPMPQVNMGREKEVLDTSYIR